MARLLTFACFSFSATGAASEIEGGPLAEECGANAEGTCPSRGQVLLQLGDARLNKPVVLADTSADEDAIAEEAWERKMAALVAEGSKVEEHSALQCPCEGPVRRRRREASKACRRRDRSLDVASDMWQCNEETNTMECTQEGESKPKESQGVSSGDDVGATASGKIGWPSGGETKNADKWCKINVPPSSWNLKSCPSDGGLKIKVLTYNLYWWNLFLIRHGNGDSAGRLIRDTDTPEYDVMGFQECEDLPRVLAGANLEGKYTLLQSKHSLCLAFHTAQWTLLSEGSAEIAEDAHPQYYGRRSVQWVRIKRKGDGKILLFMNHHGPLPTNSGGICGGPATAHHILRRIHENGKPGDAVILVGDFNSNPHSTELQVLTTKLKHVYNGAMNEGIDNIFTNIDGHHVAEVANLGNGGSDHDALSCILEVGGPALQKKVLGPQEALAEGVAGCECGWAKNDGACDAPDRSPCWAHCCHQPPPAPPAPAKAVPNNDCTCKCDWASNATCTVKPSDASCCWRKCCVSFVKDPAVALK